MMPDAKVSGILAAGMVYLDDKAGTPQDYTEDGKARTLLMEYVRYSMDSALEVFETNYQALILGMQNERRVTAYAVESALPSET